MATYLEAKAGTEGRCNERTSPCKARYDMEAETPRCCIEAHLVLLRELASRLDAAGISWWLDYGMLLGYATSGGWYWNDRDIDICVLHRDYDKVREIGTALRREFGWISRFMAPNLNKPWRLGDCHKITLSRQNKATLDIAVWYERPDGVLDRKVWASVDRYKGREMPREWVFPTRTVRWEGLDVQVPAEPEKLVAYRYGDGWKNLNGTRHDQVERPALTRFGRSRRDWEIWDWEGIALSSWAEACEGGEIVEIGGYAGRSACWLAEGSARGPGVRVTTVDPWEPYLNKTDMEAVYDEYRRTVREHGLGLVDHIRARSVDAAKEWDRPVALLYVDGDHSAAACRADLRAWLPHMAERGVIALHDSYMSGVERAITSVLVRDGWTHIETTRSLAVYAKEDTVKYLEAKMRRRGAPENKAMDAPAEDKQTEEWPLKMDPAAYVALNEGSANPEVQERVALARRILEAE